MPFERIYSDVLPYGEDEPAVSVLEVRWDRDGQHVELTTKTVRRDDGSDYHPPLEAIEIDPLPIHSGDKLVGMAFPEGELLEAEGITQSGVTIQLNRKQCNEAIMLIRRARSVTYGKDE